ncbi:DNA-packaging protein [Xenorhabdus griffiniae]|uniref:DNA-packaging protein n=1 Tax=Xenorhabdus griffiniae TaxID=351672 RepID=UPI002358E795|nr:DNA-packaging protein [Xenorhabdus griffiniae]MDC9605589.1 DNA-packaging protein [Xenorhabdus griffiniae]
MAAPKGNRFWETRSSHGRNPKFGSPEELWKACCEYFAWVEENPLYETKAFHNQGEIVYAKMAKMRAMTLSGLCIFLDISRSTWTEYTKREDFSNITTRVEQIIYDQKFSGAAADLLNANIIARDLGLKEQTVNDHLSTDGSMSPAKIILVAGGQHDDSTD